MTEFMTMFGAAIAMFGFGILFIISLLGGVYFIGRKVRNRYAAASLATVYVITLISFSAAVMATVVVR